MGLGLAGYATVMALQQGEVAAEKGRELESAFALIEDAYAYLDPRHGSAAAPVVEAAIQAALGGQPLTPGVRVRALTSFAKMHSRWGLYARARELASLARREGLQQFGSADERTLAATLVLADARHELARREDDPTEALFDVETVLLETLERAQAEHGELHKLTLEAERELGKVYWSQGRAPEAEAQLRAAYDGFARLEGAESWDATNAGNVLGRFYLSQGELEAAEPLIVEAFQNEPFFGGDRFDQFVYRLRQSGLTRRQEPRPPITTQPLRWPVGM